LHNLEKNLGLSLIEWEGKKLKLTRDGQRVHATIHDSLNAIDAQLNTIVKAGDEIEGCIEIGVLQDHSTKILDHLMHLLANFRRKNPKVTFKIKFDTSALIEEALLDQKIDIGLMINFKERHRFNIYEIAKEEHIVATSSDYIKQSGPFSHLKDIITADLIDIDEIFTCLSPWIQKHDHGLIHELDKKSPVIIVPDFKAARELIMLGQGISVIPRYLIQNDLSSGKLVQLLPKLSSLEVRIDCAVKRGRRERLCERIFIEELRETFNL
jgi:DNA-binding transcriptional LysR family regulator